MGSRQSSLISVQTAYLSPCFPAGTIIRNAPSGVPAGSTLFISALQRILNIALIACACLDVSNERENAMIQKLFDLQKMVDRFFDEDWKISWLPDDL